MATVNALSVALFNAAAGGYSADMAKNPAAYAAAVGAVLEKDLSSDAAFVTHLLGNLGFSTSDSFYADASAAVSALVVGNGRANAAATAVDFLNAQTVDSPLAAIATAFAAKVTAAAAFSSANSSELDVSKLIAAVTGVDTDVVATDAAFAAGAASRDAEVADLEVEVAGLQEELAATQAAAAEAAQAAAEELAASEQALADANATITLINDTDYASEQAAYDAGAASRDAEVAALEAQLDPFLNPVGGNFVLTSSATADLIIGTAGDDTVTATSATMAATDLVIDQSTTDNDTMNITLTAANNTAQIRNIENLNINWNAFGTASYDATNTVGSTITLSSTKTGFLGSASVSNAGANTITAGTGMDGTLTVTGATNSTVNAGEATAVSVTSSGAAATSLILNAGANTTSVTVADYNSMTVDAGTAATISLTDDDNATDQSDTATLTFGANATLTNAVDDLTVQASAAGLALTVSAVGASLTVAGDHAIALTFANMTTLDGETVSAAGSTVVATGATGGATDLSSVVADSFTFEGSVGAAITVASGANVVLEADGGASTSFVVGSGSSDVLNLTVQSDQTALSSDAETTNLTVSATAVANAADVTLTTLAGGGNYVITSDNDFNVDGVVAGEVDASAVTGAFDLDQAATAAALDVIGSATAANTVTFTGTTHSSNYVGGEGVDAVDFATTSGSATASVANGNNAVDLLALAGGDAVVTAGDGNDTVRATALTTGNFTANLGNGNNSVSVGGSGTLAGANVVITTGDGNDSVTITATHANDNITLALGDGVDTLNVSVDSTAGTWTVSGLDKIAIGSANTAAKVNATLLNGKSYTIEGDGTATDRLTVEFDAAGTGDFSNIVMDNTLTKGLAGLAITGHSGNDTITGTSGSDTIASNGGNDTITGGLGADSLTGDTGIDTFVIASADTGITVATADFITSFTSTTDKLKLGVAGTVANYTEIAGVDGDAIADTLVDVNTAMDGTVKYVLVYGLDVLFATGGADAADGALFIDADMDGTADDMIVLVGAGTDAALAFGDIIA